MTVQEAKRILTTPIKQLTQEEKKQLRKALELLGSSWGNVNNN